MPDKKPDPSITKLVLNATVALLETIASQTTKPGSPDRPGTYASDAAQALHSLMGIGMFVTIVKEQIDAERAAGKK